MPTRRFCAGLAAVFAFVLGVTLAPRLAAQPGPGVQATSPTIRGWSKETFNLPPIFAPSLPKGKESLRFAPGWNKPGSEGFWSYAFVMWIEEQAPDAKRLDTLLEIYYNGILGSFATSAGKDISKTPARVDIKRVGSGRYEATMNAIDAFATFKPIKVRLLVESVPEGADRSSLRIQLSPQPKTHPIWKSLDLAVADIVAKDSPKAARPPITNSRTNPNPMAGFGRLVGSRWRTEFSQESYVVDRWSWGPGHHSVHSRTEGIMPNGDPWNTVTVYYWHPVHQTIRWLTVSPAARGIGEGTFAFDGTQGGGDYDLYQSSGRRPLAIRWAFDGPDKYHHDLLDRVAGGYELQNAQIRRRIAAAAPGERVGIVATGARAKPSVFLKPLARLLGSEWQGNGILFLGRSPSSNVRSTTTFEYVPDADMILGRVMIANGKAAPIHALDLFLLHHTGRQSLRALALGNVDGKPVVLEGDIVSSNSGKTLTFNLKHSAGSRTKDVVVRLDLEGTLHQRIWEVSGTKRSLLEENRFRPSSGR